MVSFAAVVSLWRFIELVVWGNEAALRMAQLSWRR